MSRGTCLAHLLGTVAQKGAPGGGSAAVHQGLASHQGIPRRGLLVPRQDGQRGGLAGTIGPQEPKALAGRDPQTKIMHCYLDKASPSSLGANNDLACVGFMNTKDPCKFIESR